MGKLDVHIRHGGGGDRTAIYVSLAIAVMVLVGVTGAAISAALMMLVIWVGSIIGGGLVLGSLAYYLTRGRRAQNARAIQNYRDMREEAYHQHKLDIYRAKAQITAEENAGMAAMIAAAIQAGQQQPPWPAAAYSPPPPKIYAEVLKPEDTD